MATQIIELRNRVFEVTVTPDTPGWTHRTVLVRLLSGPPMTYAEARRLLKRLVRQVQRNGGTVLGTDIYEEEP